LEKQGSGGHSSAGSESESLKQQMLNLQQKQKSITDRGSITKARLDHIAHVEAFVGEVWGKDNPNECPSCGADHSLEGGISKVIASLHERTTAARNDLREEYNQVKGGIELIQRKLAALGVAQCPIAPGDRIQLAEAFVW